MPQQLLIEVPDELAALVAEALRAVYPSVVAGAETDGDAMRQVVAWWTANLLADHQAEKVRQAKLVNVRAAQEDLERSVALTRQRAWSMIETAMTPSGVPSEVPPEGE